jgi:tetratricopeptide (TPR) repeat protein
MAQIIKFPAQASKLGFKRVRKRAAAAAADQDQLDLFPGPRAQILSFESGLSSFEQALLLDERGDLRAADLYLKAIEEQIYVADAYCNLGIIESKRENPVKAFDCFSNALKQEPRHAEAHYNLANLYFEIDDFRLARLHYEMAGQVDPSFANAFFNLALVQAITSDFDGAWRALKKYRELVSEQEGRVAEDLLQNLIKSLSGAKAPRFSA